MKSIFKAIIVFLITLEAKMVLAKYNPRIIAVTGNVGKTSTKDAIFTVLSSDYYVRKSEKSFNSEIGVPLTILGRPNAWTNPIEWIVNVYEGLLLILFTEQYPKWLVLEVGADRPGDIRSMSRWLHPDIVVVTKIPEIPVHVEFFSSPEALVLEKAHLVRALKPGGMLIVDGDDETVRDFMAFTKEDVYTYGFGENAALRASHAQIVYERGTPVGMTFKADNAGNSVPITIRGIIGNQIVRPILAALLVGITQGFNLVSMGKRMSEHKTPPGRMRVLEGIRGSILIDDTYNSSPAAAGAALECLHAITAKGRRITVLGDMLELGSYSGEAHKKLGATVASVADLLVTIGVRARAIAEGAHEAGMRKKQMLKFDDAISAGEKLASLIETGDIVLLKGSESIRVEKATRLLMKDPSQAHTLLVRQDPEWQRR